ncbi:MAG: hypothetical protein GY861_28390 [bacterium]|nr:hypothetical protein [bacterium]
MVDRWGRPTLSDGMQIANAFMGIQKFQDTQKDRELKDSFRTETDNFFSGRKDMFTHKPTNYAEAVGQTAALDNWVKTEEGRKAYGDMTKEKDMKDFQDLTYLSDRISKAAVSDDKIKQDNALKALDQFANDSNNAFSSKINDDGTIDLFLAGKPFREKMNITDADKAIQDVIGNQKYYQFQVASRTALQEKNKKAALDTVIWRKKGQPSLRVMDTYNMANDIMSSVFDAETGNAVDKTVNDLREEGYTAGRPEKKKPVKQKTATEFKKEQLDIESKELSIKKAKKELETMPEKEKENKLNDAKKRMDVILRAFKGATKPPDEYGNVVKISPLDSALDIAERYRDPDQRETLTPQERKKIKSALKAWELYSQYSDEFGPEIKKQEDWRTYQ